jgi:hypothetical protein
VYDLLGREVATLVDRQMTAGHYRVNLNASGLASGIYMFRLSAGSFRETRKLKVIK